MVHLVNQWVHINIPFPIASSDLIHPVGMFRLPIQNERAEYVQGKQQVSNELQWIAVSSRAISTLIYHRYNPSKNYTQVIFFFFSQWTMNAEVVKDQLRPWLFIGDFFNIICPYDFPANLRRTVMTSRKCHLWFIRDMSQMAKPYGEVTMTFSISLLTAAIHWRLLFFPHILGGRTKGVDWIYFLRLCVIQVKSSQVLHPSWEAGSNQSSSPEDGWDNWNRGI